MLALSLLVCSTAIRAQENTHLDLVDTTNVRYIVDTTDNYPGSEQATWIIDYYFTDGISTGDRYAYEIILIDSILMFAFSSPETEDLRYVSFQKKIKLTEDLQDSIIKVVSSAGLYQRKPGVPHPIASAHTQEVLVVRGPSIHVQGGLFNLKVFEDDIPEPVIQAEIAHERRITSSIGGDHDKVFDLMKGLFKELESLQREVHWR